MHADISNPDACNLILFVSCPFFPYFSGEHPHNRKQIANVTEPCVQLRALIIRLATSQECALLLLFTWLTAEPCTIACRFPELDIAE